MRTQLAGATAVSIAVAALLSGCAGQSLPTYDEVRAETESAMQQIADEMPDGSRIEDLTDATPFACNGGGVFFTGHWFVHSPDGFDARSFIEGLPASLSSDFTVEDLGVPVSFPAVSLRYRPTGVGLDVSNPREAEYPGINILATSRCAQDPGDS